ncbi:hypothetical protein B0H13DRAFT_2338296 [Mycena leptocephala]|nr:hypothetical protein B0H13DRAFT_2338296 [Mycena leptocephala]
MSRRTRTTRGKSEISLAPLRRLVPLAYGQLNLKYMKYVLDLGTDTSPASVSVSPSAPRRAPLRPNFNSTREQEANCGICFEHAVSPVRTSCCVHVFCAEHIATWLHGPASDGCCPACRAHVSPATVLHSKSLPLSDSTPPRHPSRTLRPSPTPTAALILAPPLHPSWTPSPSTPPRHHRRTIRRPHRLLLPPSNTHGSSKRGAALSLAHALGYVVVVPVLAGGGGGVHWASGRGVGGGEKEGRRRVQLLL